MKRNYCIGILSICMLFILGACQKMNRPELGDYPKDTNPTGGPLKFYAAFDGTSNDAKKNAIDSIQGTKPVDNPLSSVPGISGNAIKGESKKFVKYGKPNDWAAVAKSFTISFWYKKSGQTLNNINQNGPEFPLSFKSTNGHWSGSNMFILLEGNNSACAVKVMIVNKNMGDVWLVWEGGQSIAGLLDGTWKHIAFVYNASTSGLTLYVNGVANPNIKYWAGQGDINISNSAISEMRVGCGPQNDFNTGDWLSSSFKGDLDQLRMYSTALSASEIMNLYTIKK